MGTSRIILKASGIWENESTDQGFALRYLEEPPSRGRGSERGWEGHRAHASSRGAAAAELQCGVAMWVCILSLAKSNNFLREMKNSGYYINLIIFKYWQLFKKF